MRKSSFALLLVGSLFFMGGFAVVPAWGSVYLTDSFLTGTNSGAGEYTTGGLYAQAPYNDPFYGTWNGGLTTTNTSAFQVVGTGLTYAGLYGVDGGSVQYTGSSSVVGSGAQALLRNFTGISLTAGADYYMSGLMSFDASFASSPTATAYTGLLNAEQGDSSVSWTIGTQWGFQVNATGGVDAVVLNRQWLDDGSAIDVKTEVLASNITPGTYQFTFRMSPDYTGSSSDLLVGWSNPNAAMDEFAGPNPQLINQTAQSWLLDTGDSTRLVDSLVLTATDVPDGSVVGYDEVRFGDTWEEVLAAPGTTQEVVQHPLAHDPVTLAEGSDGYEMTCVELRANYTTGVLEGRDEYLIGGLSSSQPGIRGYLEFDLNGLVIPDGASISGVSLDTRVKRTDIRGAGVGEIQLRLADPQVPVVEAEATWDYASAATPWSVEAGDPTTTVLGAVDGDALAANDWVNFASTPEFMDAVNAALAGDGLLQMTFMAPDAEADAMNNNLRNFVGFYSDDSSYVPKLTFEFANDNPPQQTAPAGEQVAYAAAPGDGVVAGTIVSGRPEENHGESEVLVVGASDYEIAYEKFRTVASIPVSEDMIPEGKEVVGVALQLSVERIVVDGAGLGDIELRLSGDSGMVETEMSWDNLSGDEENGFISRSEAGGTPGALLSILDSDYAMTVGNNVWFESTPEFLAAFNDALTGDGMLDLLLMAPEAEEYLGISNYILFGSDEDSNESRRPQLILLLEDISQIAGDANGDGKVDGSDVTILAGNWQKGVNDGLTASWEEGDFNGDGKVDGSDVTILAGNWQYGVDATAASVPEPSMILLILSALAGLMLVRRK